MKSPTERHDATAGISSPKNGVAPSVALRFFPGALFTICFACAWALRANQQVSVANFFLLTSSALATLLVLNQRLPLQNILSLVTVIALVSGASMLAAVYFKTKLIAPFLLARFPGAPVWTTPLLWVVALVNARGIAQLFLRPMRKTSIYGLWLIGVASFIAAGFNVAAQTDWKIFSVQLAMAAIVFVATIPWFIDKRRVEQPAEFQPLVIIGLLLFW